MKIPAVILEAMRGYAEAVTAKPSLIELHRELRRCAAMTKRGERCRRYSLLGGQVCVTHYRTASGAKLKT